MTETTGPPAEALHPNPNTDGLTDEQRRGGACTYCGGPLATGTAVDLGERRDSDGVRVFPRACPACAERCAS
ncbi:hypothetical protein [Streptomyces sp. NRRL F-5126]|uniref:hypothetical protein n=1 Tax=Streptomyces sp. NRRL F-5126 TaxID=1463857 RepID=UPI00099CB50F|nr:hypothetical protein [Streptomyces sp. NRRL F-5126]